MRIKTSYDSFIKAVNAASGILSDKLLQDDLRNFVITCNGEDVEVVTNNFRATCFSNIEDVQVEYDEGESQDMHTEQLQAKDLLAVLNTLKGLRRTKVSELEFVFRPDEKLLFVHEIPSDDDLLSANKYCGTTRYRLISTRMKDSVRKEIVDLKAENDTTDYVTFKSEDLLKYFNALIPTINSEARDTPATRLNISADYAYTMPQQYGALIKNTVGDEFADFVLPSSAAEFMRHFLNLSEIVQFSKRETNKLVILRIANQDAIAIIKAISIKEAYNIKQFVEIPVDGVAVDKLYLSDVVKRMSLSEEPINIKIDLTSGEMDLICKKFTQPIPILKHKGEGVFNFSIKADLFAALMFNHVTTSELLFIRLAVDANGRAVMGMQDDSKEWHTKIRGLSPARGGEAVW